MSTASNALDGTRIVVPVPTVHENGGLSHQVSLGIMAGLRSRGADVFPFDMSYVVTGDLRDVFAQMPKLDAFRPDLVVVNGIVQAQQCRTSRGFLPNGRFIPNNLFVDNLKLPTVVIWDDFAVAFATLGYPTFDPARSIDGTLAALREQINNPLFFHCFLDPDHAATLRRLGVLTTPNVRHRLATIYGPSEAYGRGPPEPGYDETVAFTGNLFSDIPRRGAGEAAAIVDRFLQAVLARADADICVSYWDAVEAVRAELGAADCRTARLEHDQSFFWEFVTFDLLGTLVTRTRLNALRACRQPVSIYGLMHNPSSRELLRGSPHLTFKQAVPFTELPRLNQRTKVTLDVVTPLFISGITAKIAGCFAAGGLCLFNAKPAFREAFGADADHVMYRDLDEMNAKLEHLLSHDRERAELSAFFKREILEKHTYTTMLAEVVAWAKASGTPAGG